MNPRHDPHRLLTLDALIQRGVALDAKLARVRYLIRDVPQADAQAWSDAYRAWYTDALPHLDADLQQQLTAAHHGTDDQPGTQRLLELLVQACDPDPALAAPALAILRPQFCYAPLGDPFGAHLEILETARRRAFPATHGVPEELTDLIATSQWRYTDGRIDHLFITSGCEPHWWLRALIPYKRQSARRVQGWFAALQVHAPEREIAIVQAVCRAVLRDPRLTDAQREALQTHLAQLHTPPVPPSRSLLPDRLPAHDASAVSCFLSYSSADEALAKRLYADLQAEGVRCWFAPHDLEIGEPILSGIDRGMRLHARVLLILSAASVASAWIEQEVQMALARERDERRRVLVPIRIDDAVSEQTAGWPALVWSQRHVGDFRGWKQYDEYQQVFQRLLRELRQAQRDGE